MPGARILGSWRALGIGAAALCLGTAAFIGSAFPHDELNGRPHHIDAPMNPTATMKAFLLSKGGESLPAPVNQAALSTPCVGGTAGGLPCENVDLNRFVPRSEMGGDRSNDELNDLWGWTDPINGNEYALVGRVFGTSFVDVTDPGSPVYVGELPLHGTFGSPWRDIKVYRNHAFIVSEARNDGMQVFDLARLHAAAPGTTFTEDAHYAGFGNAHNLVINEESGFAYAVGTNTCSGGLAMVDIRDPLNPAGAGCYSGDGYTHDAVCVNYRGPDLDHQGKEICFASNEDTVTIVDVTDKSNPVMIHKATYPNARYTHQGWLSEDHTRFFFDDELDERDDPDVTQTTTRAWDITDLDNFDNSGLAPPQTFGHDSGSIDHNLYVEGRFIFEANYQSGLRILEMTDGTYGDPGGTFLQPAGHFDVYPEGDAAAFNGAWSNYPYFASGTVVVSHIEQGLFVLTPQIDRVAFGNVLPGEELSGSMAIDVVGSDPGGVIAPTLTFTVDGRTPENSDGATWDTNLEDNGLHRLTARMIDADGNETSSTILVTVLNAADNTPPTVEISSPADGATVSGIVQLVADATDVDGAVAAVEFYATAPDGIEKLIGSASLSGSIWTLNWNTKKVDKTTYVIRAIATDDQNATSEATVSVTVSGGGGGGGGGGGCPPKKPGCSA